MTMDRYRPSYHFTPPHNWMNDPNGPFQLNGEYHLFYQHNPSAPQWGTIHWGHAKSTDLVNWTHLPVALAPSNELGESHCYSGCSVVNGDEVKLFYTSIGEGERNATSGAQQWTAGAGEGDLLTWRKPGDANPALTSELHGETRITEWRDPYVWKQQDGWRMLLGGIEGEKGCGMIYSSDDLEKWDYKGIFYKGEEWIWECPHLFRFDDDKAVLFYSPSGPVRYLSGTIREDRLTDVMKHGTIDGGGWEGYYASTGFVDENGRRIMLGWAPEGRGENFPVSLDWAGTLALPRVVELKPNGALAMAPVPELEKLRGDSRSFAKLNIGQAPKDMGIRSTACEIVVDVDRRTLEDGELVVALFASSCGRERTDVRLDLAANTVVIDRLQSSLFPNVNKSAVEAKLPDAAGAETLRLRIFADQSIIEVFADDETCLTARVYPSLEDSNGIELRSSGGVAVCDVKIWEMKAAELQ
ncbi:glycoside hydrolase family 32 protein [Paenibacillus sp. CF384]|uniref:glycoside hydrolase family 32 protein n=1 Tax=Paenibacillus sp. CF384 TaxID=1884382 RepID=UPI000895A7BD|nr:glycoside hydrolase family 32 protein [Paenibacillus sp. CF384]SDX61373.1 beta-fructofuranosidase [Paenibacillus sp. CF384]